MRMDRTRGCAGGTPPTVLVIDDDGATQDLLALLLGSAGYTLLRADSGEAGLALLDQAPVDLVVLDLRLPGLDGFDVCVRIRERADRQPPILVLTATTRPNGATTSFQVGPTTTWRSRMRRGNCSRASPGCCGSRRFAQRSMGVWRWWGNGATAG